MKRLFWKTLKMCFNLGLESIYTKFGVHRPIRKNPSLKNLDTPLHPLLGDVLENPTPSSTLLLNPLFALKSIYSNQVSV